MDAAGRRGHRHDYDRKPAVRLDHVRPADDGRHGMEVISVAMGLYGFYCGDDLGDAAFWLAD
jgi:hypothetical protein